MRLRNRSLCAAALLPVLFLCGGCEFFAEALGYPGKHLLIGQDVLAVPGQLVTIEARLRKASPFWEPPARTVYIFLDANIYFSGQSEPNGTVAATFRPAAPGDYHFRVECHFTPGQPALETDVLVACRAPDTPLCVVDIDHTIAQEARKRDVVFGEPNAMPYSVPVLSAIANRYTVIYLTHRWDYLEKKTRQWLSEQGFPDGPIIAARGAAQVTASNEKFKSDALAEIRKQFTGPGYGIGDEASDVLAYTSAGLKGVLIRDMCELTKAEAVRDAIQELSAVPDSAQAVCGWTEFGKIVFEGASFPVSAARQRLQEKLKSMEGGK